VVLFPISVDRGRAGAMIGWSSGWDRDPGGHAVSEGDAHSFDAVGRYVRCQEGVKKAGWRRDHTTGDPKGRMCGV